MIKKTLLAAAFIATLVPQSQARPRPIWSFLGGVAVGAAVANNYYQPYYAQPYYADPYYCAPPPVVYYGRPAPRYYGPPPAAFVYDRWGNCYRQPRCW
jgi:hypothetical protein